MTDPKDRQELDQAIPFKTEDVLDSPIFSYEDGEPLDLGAAGKWSPEKLRESDPFGDEDKGSPSSS